MDNLSALAKDYQPKQRLLGNWVKSPAKGEQPRRRERVSQERLRSEDNERECDIRSKILDTK